MGGQAAALAEIERFGISPDTFEAVREQLASLDPFSAGNLYLADDWISYTFRAKAAEWAEVGWPSLTQKAFPVLLAELTYEPVAGAAEREPYSESVCPRCRPLTVYPIASPAELAAVFAAAAMRYRRRWLVECHWRFGRAERFGYLLETWRRTSFSHPPDRLAVLLRPSFPTHFF